MGFKGQASKEVIFHQAVMAFYGLAKRIARREALDTMEAELNKIAQALPGNTANFAGALKLAIDLSEQSSVAAPTLTPPIRLKPVHWKKHAKGKERTWTATWEGMKLLVVRKKTGDSGVVFDGMIDDKPVTRGKLLTQVQTELSAEAYRRAVTAR